MWVKTLPILCVKEVNLSYCPLHHLLPRGIRALLKNWRQLQAVRLLFGFTVNLDLVLCRSWLLNAWTVWILEIASGGGFGLWSTNISLSLIQRGHPWKCFHLSLLSEYVKRQILDCFWFVQDSQDDEHIIAITKVFPLLRESNLALCHIVRLPGWTGIWLLYFVVTWEASCELGTSAVKVFRPLGQKAQSCTSVTSVNSVMKF